VHPIEHLRHVARARGVDAISLARETAIALGSLHADRANLVIACRRIVERHPDAGPLWWLCSHLLTAEDPTQTAWTMVDRFDDDPTPQVIASVVPGGTVVLTIGWPATGGAALMRCDDVTVWCVDSNHEASAFMQRLERLDVACEPISIEYLGRAALQADVVMIDALAASTSRVIAPIGSHVLAAVANSVGTPVWLAVGLGRRLPPEYIDEIAIRLTDQTSLWDVLVDDLPIGLATHVVSSGGISDRVIDALRADCPFAPELLRRSSF
jgi:hypothetical protein